MLGAAVALLVLACLHHVTLSKINPARSRMSHRADRLSTLAMNDPLRALRKGSLLRAALSALPLAGPLLTTVPVSATLFP